MVKRVPTDPPTPTFPYKISKRLNKLSIPRMVIVETDEGLPELTPSGVSKRALRAKPNERLNNAASPYIWRLLLIKRLYRKSFSPERLEIIDRLIERANSTIYAKLSKFKVDLKRKETKKKRGWSESDWSKHMEYINKISVPIKFPPPPPVDRGPSKPLSELLPRIQEISCLPDFRCYKRMSQDIWYKDPTRIEKFKYIKIVRKEKLPPVRNLCPSRRTGKKLKGSLYRAS